jgi:hypothetical protein
MQVNEDGLTIGDVGDILFASDSAAQPVAALNTQLTNGQPLQRLASGQPSKLATCPPLPQLDDRDVVVEEEEEVVVPTLSCNNIADNGSSNSINGSPSNSDHSIRSDSSWSSNEHAGKASPLRKEKSAVSCAQICMKLHMKLRPTKYKWYLLYERRCFF